MDPAAIKISPHGFEDARRQAGELYRAGHDVLMDLSAMPDGDAKRTIDFCAGMIWTTRGTIERRPKRVFVVSHSDQPPEEPAR